MDRSIHIKKVSRFCGESVFDEKLHVKRVLDMGGFFADFP